MTCLALLACLLLQPPQPEDGRAAMYRIAFAAGPRVAHAGDVDALRQALEDLARPAWARPMGQGDAQPVRVERAVILGPLTANGKPAEYALLAELAAGSLVPIVWCPADADAADLEKHLGPLPIVSEIGEDALLLVDERDPLDLSKGALAGRIEQARRRIAPKRWSIGAAAALGPAMPMRVQLTLFADTPLHAFAFGQAQVPADAPLDFAAPAAPSFPWSETAPIATPPWPETKSFVVVDVTPFAVGTGLLEEAPSPSPPRSSEMKGAVRRCPPARPSQTASGTASKGPTDIGIVTRCSLCRSPIYSGKDYNSPQEGPCSH